MVATEWRIRPFDPTQIEHLARASGLHPLLAQILIHRGVTTPDAARQFLDPRRDALHDPEALPGAADAALRLVRAVQEQRKIVIYGDYDVDGVCGTAILYDCLRLAGAHPDQLEYYIPHRVDEGYGLNAEALRSLAQSRGAQLVITVDCGVTAVAEAQLARDLGIELIITDHHTPGPVWPDAHALVHPRAHPGNYPFLELCGAAVAFKVAWQVCKSFGDGKKASPHLREFLVHAINLVALATVADVVPLEDENRIFVRHGLRGLSQERSEGLRALLQVSGCLGRPTLGTGQIGFGIAPRINAAGRMECAMAAVELLLTADPARAAELAARLDECNTRRKEMERATLQQAHALIEQQGGSTDRGALVVASDAWHPGVIGIVASRLVDAYHRPALVIALRDGVGQGSGRSLPGFDLHAALAACSEHLTTFGGHKAAAGLKLEAGRLAAFSEAFDSHCRALLTPELRRKTLAIDAEVPLPLLNTRLVADLDKLEPFGIGNPRPLLASSPVRLAAPPRPVGDDGHHLQLTFEQNGTRVRAIAWNLAARYKSLPTGALCALAFHPTIDTWRDRHEVKLEIKDIKLLDDQSAPPQPAGVVADPANP